MSRTVVVGQLRGHQMSSPYLLSLLKFLHLYWIVYCLDAYDMGTVANNLTR